VQSFTGSIIPLEIPQLSKQRALASIIFLLAIGQWLSRGIITIVNFSSFRDATCSMSREKNKMTPLQHSLSGAVAGVASRLVIAPLDVIKIRLQLQSQKTSVGMLFSSQSHASHKYKTMLQATQVIVREEGVLALWKGNWSATFLYFGYGAVQFYSYNVLGSMASNKDGIFNLIPHQFHTFVSGGLAAVIATTLTYPMDLLRTRFAAQGQDQIYKSLYGAVKSIRATEGLAGFYRGLIPSTISVLPQMGLVFHFHEFYRKRYDSILQCAVSGYPSFDAFLVGSRDLVTGALAGITSKVLVMPFDVVR
jgi:solute carrier family 25 thiamine pyrophosphate transporter 19